MQSTSTVDDPISQLAAKLKAAYDLRVSDLSQSINLTLELLNQFIEGGHHHLTATAKNRLGLFYLIQGEFETSQKYSEEALDFFESNDDVQGIADAKYNIGGVYYRSDKYHQGLLMLSESLRGYHELNDHYNQARTHKSIGTIYEYFNDQDKAVDSYEKSIKAAQVIGELGLESNALNPLSAIYFSQGKHDLAMQTIERSIELKNKTGDIRGLAFALYGRGKLFIKLGQGKKAIEDLEEAIRIMEMAGDKLGLGMAYNKLGVAHMELNELPQAKKYFDQVVWLTETAKIAFNRFKVYYNLYLLAKKMNEPEKALGFLEKHLVHKEAVINQESYNVIKSYDAVNRIHALEHETKVEKEKNLIIESKNDELDSFFYRVSHDLKGPIASLQGLNNLIKLDIKDADSLRYFEMYNTQINRMHNIVMSLIDLTQMKHLGDSKGKIDFALLVDECIASYSYFENFKSITFIKEIDLHLNYYSEWAIINTIMQNLIENAIKYSGDEKPFVKVSVQQNGSFIQIEVEDNGHGIDEVHQAKIFDMFYRASERAKGSGLGLYILKRAVERLNGIIKLKSKLHEGSTFSISLPA